MTRQSDAPRFQSTGKTFNSPDEYLAFLDDLLKRNTGTGLHVGADVSSNTPMLLPNAVPQSQPFAIAPSIEAQQGQLQPVERRYKSLNDAPTGDSPQDASGDLNSIDGFFGAIRNRVSQNGYDSRSGIYNSSSRPVANMIDGGILYEDNIIRYSDGTEREYRGVSAEPIQSMRDGSVRYSDGTFRRRAPQPIQSVVDPQSGREILRFDDGSLRWGRYLTTPSTQKEGGVAGLSKMLFGRNQTVTQQYGNVNPIEPTPGNRNLGTDFRTRDLTDEQRQLDLPYDTEVVQVYYDDGTRFGSKSGHKGYGNSLLLRLPTGEMIRVSHLSQMLDVKPGDVITAGEVFGVPGTTGNTYGEHADVEYYNADGQIDDPANFSGVSTPELLFPDQEQPGTVIRDGNILNAPMSGDIRQSIQPEYREQNRQPAKPIQQEVNPLASLDVFKEAPKQFRENVIQPATDVLEEFGTANKAPKLGIGELGRGDIAAARKEFGETTNQAGKVLGVGTEEGFAGIGEAIAGDQPAARQERQESIARGQFGETNPYRYLAGNLIEKAGDMMGLLEGQSSEVIAGGPTRRTNMALAADENFKKMQSPYELDQYPKNIKGDVQRVADATTAQLGGAVKPAFSFAQRAATAPKQLLDKGKQFVDSLADNVDQVKDVAEEKLNQLTDVTQNAAQQAGQGVEKLKGQLQGVGSSASNIFSRPDINKPLIKGRIGEDTPSSANVQGEMSSAANESQREKNDTRDEFFKQGGAETFKSFLKLNAEQMMSGALGLDLFNDDFYKDLGNIASVFGGSKDKDAAVQKYVNFEKQKYPYMSRMGYSDDYDRGSVDDYNRSVDQYNNELNSYFASIPASIAGATSIYLPQPTASKKPVSGVASMSRAVFSAPAQRMSVAGPQMSASRPNMSVAPRMSFAAPVRSSAPMINTALMSIAPKAAAPTVKAPSTSGKPLAPMSYAKPYTPAPKAAPKPNPSPKINTSLMSVAPKAAPKPAAAPAKSSSSSSAANKAVQAVKNTIARAFSFARR